MSILGLFSQFLIVWITQTWQSFKVISCYVHVYNTLLCKTKMYLFLHFTLLVKLFETYLIHYCWFGLKKKLLFTSNNTIFIIYFWLWGGGVDFVFNHVTFIGCFFSNIIQLLFTLSYYCINVILLVNTLCWVLLIWLYTVHNSFSKNKFRKNKQLIISCIFSYDCYL